MFFQSPDGKVGYIESVGKLDLVEQKTHNQSKIPDIYRNEKKAKWIFELIRVWSRIMIYLMTLISLQLRIAIQIHQQIQAYEREYAYINAEKYFETTMAQNRTRYNKTKKMELIESRRSASRSRTKSVQKHNCFNKSNKNLVNNKISCIL